MQNTIYSNIIIFYQNDNQPDCIIARYSEDLEEIGLIRMSSSVRDKPFIDTEYGRLLVNFEWSFAELEKQILKFIDSKKTLEKWAEKTEERQEDPLVYGRFN